MRAPSSPRGQARQDLGPDPRRRRARDRSPHQRVRRALRRPRVTDPVEQELAQARLALRTGELHRVLREVAAPVARGG
eukprot:3795028-Alexandrium_andersonii.AAC.1